MADLKQRMAASAVFTRPSFPLIFCNVLASTSPELVPRAFCEPIFVEAIGDMPETIMSVVRDGDVVMTMGAGSISGVPAKLTNYPKV